MGMSTYDDIRLSRNVPQEGNQVGQPLIHLESSPKALAFSFYTSPELTGAYAGSTGDVPVICRLSSQYARWIMESAHYAVHIEKYGIYAGQKSLPCLNQ
jgi:hypothetical protein